jgi:hypothetical protein
MKTLFIDVSSSDIQNIHHIQQTNKQTKTTTTTTTILNRILILQCSIRNANNPTAAIERDYCQLITQFSHTSQAKRNI